MKFYVILFLICCYTNAYTQDNIIADIENELFSASTDTAKIRILNNLSAEKVHTYPEEALSYAKAALELSKNQKSDTHIAESFHKIGIAYYFIGNFSEALDYIQKSIDLYENIITVKPENERINTRLPHCYNDIGNIYSEQGNYTLALSKYLNALKIFEKLKYKNGISICLSNIGNVYGDKKMHKKALEYYFKAYKIENELNNKNGIAEVATNISIEYQTIGKTKESFEYLNKALDIILKTDDKYALNIIYSNFGDNYSDIENYHKAIEYYNKSIKIAKEISDQIGVITNLNSIANSYLKLSEPNKALKYALESKELVKNIDSKEYQKNVYQILSEIYAELINYSEAYKYKVESAILQDSIYNNDIKNRITNLQAIYELDKKHTEIKLLKKVNEIQQLIRNIFIVGFIAVIIVVIVIFISLKQKQKANKTLIKKKNEINKQKKEIQYQAENLQEINILLKDKNNEINIQKKKIEKTHSQITDSINYAGLIQTAVLPSYEDINKILTEYFILFKPRDIVSGDFYLIKKINEYIIIALADCTGHGVPGAFMSMLGIALINEIVRKNEIYSPDKALNNLREHIKTLLNQKGFDGYSNESHDGMDIALCAINTKTNIIQYAGANNPMYIIRENDKKTELIELKPDYMPIGIYIKEQPFNSITMQLKKNDVLYLFSDGYIDQFSQKGGNKFLKSRFNEILLGIYNKPMNEQKEILDKTIENWKGNIEQIDDITVFGIRI
ncbi:MAG: tetratricopeptide repeat protein [Bacteroidales bacterium]|nr:tetratricopeptide repeat protein [Bacteroidales bacterium]